MNRLALITIFSLAACTAKSPEVKITSSPAAVAKVQAQSRSEPVFFNGKTYQVGLAADPSGGYALSVTGMNAAQSKDAAQISTSSLRYFACKDSQQAKMIGQPSYQNNRWTLRAHCI